MRLNLKKARADAGLTQREVAEKVGISLEMYTSIENGRREGKGHIWDKLQDLFGDQKKLRAVHNKEAV